MVWTDFKVLEQDLPTTRCFHDGNTKCFCQRRVQKYVTLNQNLADTHHRKYRFSNT